MPKVEIALDTIHVRLGESLTVFIHGNDPDDEQRDPMIVQVELKASAIDGRVEVRMKPEHLHLVKQFRE